MASPIDLTALMNDPEKLKLIQEQAISTTPMQPQVQGIGMPELPTKEKDIQRLIRQKFLESQLQQQQAVDESKRLLSEEMQKNQELGVLGRLDLRPFAAAARQYGANTAVVPTEAPTDNKELVAKLRAEIQKSQQGMSNEQIGFLKTMMEDKKAAQAMLSMGNQEMRAFENVQRKFDKPQQSMLDFYQSHDAVKSALDSGDIYAVQSALSNYARMSGEKGVLTDEDIKRVIPVNLQTKFAGWWSKIKSDPKVQAPEGVITALQSGLGRLKFAAETKYKNQITTAKNQTSRGPGIYRTYSTSAYEEAQKVLRPEEAGAAPQGGVMSESQKKRLQELRGKYGE